DRHVRTLLRRAAAATFTARLPALATPLAAPDDLCAGGGRLLGDAARELLADRDRNFERSAARRLSRAQRAGRLPRLLHAARRRPLDQRPRGARSGGHDQVAVCI